MAIEIYMANSSRKIVALRRQWQNCRTVKFYVSNGFCDTPKSKMYRMGVHIHIIIPIWMHNNIIKCNLATRRIFQTT